MGRGWGRNIEKYVVGLFLGIGEKLVKDERKYNFGCDLLSGFFIFLWVVICNLKNFVVFVCLIS